MLTHRHESDHAPKRVVILGGGGFVGRRALKRFVIGGIDVVAPGSRDLDLAAPSSVDALAGLLQPDDALVFAACLTPDKGKDIATANKNLAMASHVSAALAKRPVAQLVYLSSDAVYGAGPSLVDERTPAAP
ncbi:MAG: NAD-dependent epimerase/dehydratase family protein, partial [Alphaproteobacteria bacterium]|nr:NAD-dependent epimerase/dehydratase family protein [Alphaproteobacteria bacterium]